MSAVRKGNYYKYKTKEWLVKEGYVVEYFEKNQRIVTGDRTIFIKRDMWGADVVAMNTESIVFVQVKLNKNNVADAIKEFTKYPYPPFVKRWVVVWTPKQREPEIVEV